MNLTVLGCFGPYPAANGATSGYLLTHEKDTVLIDCGSGVLSRLFSLCDPAGLSAIFLSHLHYDHMCDVLPMAYYLEKVGVRVPLYCPEEELENARELLSPRAFEVLPLLDTLNVDGFFVKTMPVKHPVPTRAILIQTAQTACGKLVYTGDTNECEGLDVFAQQADVLLSDAAFLEKDWTEQKPHLSVLRAAQLAARAQCKQLVLTHRTPGTPETAILEEARAAFKNAVCAREGLRVEIQ